MQADLRFCWSHIPHCWKFHATAHISIFYVKIILSRLISGYFKLIIELTRFFTVYYSYDVDSSSARLSDHVSIVPTVLSLYNTSRYNTDLDINFYTMNFSKEL